MNDFYDPSVMKRHESPTKRLIDQKNSKFQNKPILNREAKRTQNYGLHYTSKPGKSYIIEPQRLDYNLAYRDPIKFYDQVMQQSVVQHKCQDNGEVTSKVTHRKIGKILKAVGKKLQDIMWMKDATEWREEDFL